MPRTIASARGREGDFPVPPEGWYAGEIVQFNEKPHEKLEDCSKLGIAWRILDGPFAKQWVWFNTDVGPEAISYSTGEVYKNTNWWIRKLQHLIEPGIYPDPEAQVKGEGLVEFAFEEADFFMGFKAAIEITNYVAQSTNKPGAKVKRFRSLQEAASDIEATKSRAPADSALDGPWSDDQQQESEDPNSDLPY
jgi:hypothetical protein